MANKLLSCSNGTKCKSGGGLHPVAFFYVQKSKKRGYTNKCKECTKEYYKKNKAKRARYYRDNAQERKDYQVNYYKENAEELREKRMERFYKDQAKEKEESGQE